MVKSVFEEGFDSSRFIISTTVTKHDEGYLCKGRLVQGRGMLLEDGEIDWNDRTATVESIGNNPTTVEGLVLENLFQYMVSKEYYLFEDKTDDSKDNIQEI